MRKITYFIVVVCAGAFLMSCSKSPQSRIIGKWENVRDKTATWEFFKDGTVLIKKGQRSIVDNYTFLDKKHLKFTYPVTQESSVFPFSLSRNKLILKENVEEYRRVK